MFNFGRGNSIMTNVSVEEAHELIQRNPDILILDVRTPNEYNAGHIPRAINIPYNILPIKIDEIEKYKDKPILVHCQSGGRSSVAVQILIQNGFSNIFHMSSGFGAWKYGIEK